MPRPLPSDQVTKRDDGALAQARKQYYEDLGLAARVLVENLKNALKSFDDQMAEARRKHDQALEAHRKGWDDFNLTPAKYERRDHSNPRKASKYDKGGHR
jgi:hypothetical protein